jgi:hypothetical protein
MKTYVLYGHTAQPGYAGDHVALAVITARDIESAGRKLKGKLAGDVHRHKDAKYFTPTRRSDKILKRIVSAHIGGSGRRPKDYEVRQALQRYSSFNIRRQYRIR